MSCEPFVRPSRVVYASPDDDVDELGVGVQRSRELAFTVQPDGRVSIAVPPLTVWGTVVIDHH